ncbi:ATP-dependent Clp protease adaptor ClpS [Saccharicrinis sp. FJH54]|uniref:ATP-dependent Clp protease adaptor ClpS n=1 Tax=Saccharicrinis sp. FJH54 TaxID=3344665 RepID=UPI0035D3F107
MVRSKLFDKYDILLEKYFPYTGIFSDKIRYDDNIVNPLEKELGFDNQRDYQLILLNDTDNDMMHVSLALFEVIHIKPKDSQTKMLETHEKGESTLIIGDFGHLNTMKLNLGKRNLKTLIRKI